VTESPDGQQVQVAYQIIHDDDNEQILEIHYQTLEEGLCIIHFHLAQ